MRSTSKMIEYRRVSAKSLYYFNHTFQVSGMVASEVINGPTQELRAQRIGYWIAVAARCRDLNNFNSVLQITSGLMKSSVYRLKKSWELVNRQVFSSRICYNHHSC